MKTTNEQNGSCAVQAVGQDLNQNYNQRSPGKRWYCLFLGYFTPVSETEVRRLSQACARFVSRIVVGDKRVFFEVELSRTSINLGALQFKIQSYAETWDLPHHFWQWGVGKTLAESWVQTRWKSLTPNQLPIEALDDYLYPLTSPVAASLKNGIGASTFNLLRCLGYQSLSDLEVMPHDLLLVRLSKVLQEGLVQREVSDPNGLLQDNWLATLTASSLAEDLKPISPNAADSRSWADDFEAIPA